MNNFIFILLIFHLTSCSSFVLAQSKNFADFKDQIIKDKTSLAKIWGKPSAEMNFNLAGKKYLYLRYTDKNQYPLADFTLDLKDNSVVERLFYPQKNIDGDIFKTFKKKYFKNITFNKVLDSCSHHDQFIHYNKAEGVVIFSHQLLNNKRLVDVIGYSKPNVIENRLRENKTKKCGILKIK